MALPKMGMNLMACSDNMVNCSITSMSYIVGSFGRESRRHHGRINTNATRRIIIPTGPKKSMIDTIMYPNRCSPWNFPLLPSKCLLGRVHSTT